jgi:hypothetical protein
VSSFDRIHPIIRADEAGAVVRMKSLLFEVSLDLCCYLIQQPVCSEQSTVLLLCDYVEISANLFSQMEQLRHHTRHSAFDNSEHLLGSSKVHSSPNRLAPPNTIELMTSPPFDVRSQRLSGLFPLTAAVLVP